MPQPIDINTEFARSTAAQRVQEVVDRASLAAQQRQVQHAQQEQIDAESVVQQSHDSGEDPAVNDRREGREQKRRQQHGKAEGQSEADHADHGAGGLAIIPEDEQHRLDVTA